MKNKALICIFFPEQTSLHNHKTKYTHSQEWVYFVLNVLLGVEPTKKLVNEKKRKTVIAFILVPQVKMPKLINFADDS